MYSALFVAKLAAKAAMGEWPSEVFPTSDKGRIREFVAHTYGGRKLAVSVNISNGTGVISETGHEPESFTYRFEC